VILIKMSYKFIHLHAHTEYSLDIGFITIDDYVKYCYDNGAFASVLTERFNLYSFIKFYNKCFEFGIKPIVGCEFFLEKFLYKRGKIIILCKNQTGYKNLTKILIKASLENEEDNLPTVKREWLLSFSEGLIIIGLSFESDIGICLVNNDYSNAIRCMNFWNKSFNNSYYLSVTRFNFPSEILFIDRLLNISDKQLVPLVATNEVCFLRADDFVDYKNKIAIFDLEKNVVVNDVYTFFENKYFKTTDEMLDTFSDMPEIVLNSSEIAKQCNLYFQTGKDYSPKYKKMNDLSMAKSLVRISFENLFSKIDITDIENWTLYSSRLSTELAVINKIGFANYFLVTHDFIVWAKNNDIYVGPGRGSGAGSLVAYTLSITDIDPLKYDLLFERFLNHERISIPDFDVDLCIENRDLVIDYIFDEYGIESVAQIVTFGCMTINAVVRDVGKILGYSYFFVNKVVKLLSGDFGLSLKHELTSNWILRNEYNKSSDVQLILNTSLKLEGLIKGIGRHAGGLIIASVKLLGYLPLSYEDDDYHFMVQLDKKDSEKLGFIKFDFLGLKTLSILSATIETLLSYKSLEKTYFFNNELLSEYNERTYGLLQSGDTIGIFQLESAGIKSVIQRLKPNLFSDIVALVALYRPGPLQSGMLHSFLARKLGFEKIDYIHPRLTEVLKETYGIVVYQEQVMLIAQVFAGYSVSAADFLRIAMSKKNPSEMQTHLRTFAFGASLFGIDGVTAEEVFYLVEKFAGYGFNKAHSVGYALLAYNSAWLKANFNIMFMASLLSSDMYNYENINIYIDECIHYGIRILIPDINRGFYCFTMSNNSIQYGLGSINGVGLSVVAEILHNRSFFGPYNCFFDFLYRIDIEVLSKKTLEALVYSGAFSKLYNQKFKLALIGAKFLDLYSSIENSGIYITTKFINDYFNYSAKNHHYMLSYKQIENRSERDILTNNILNNFLLKYKDECELISKLSYQSGKYFNFFISGLINEINIKKVNQEKYINITVSCLNKNINISLSYSKYLFLKDVIKKNNFIVVLCYEYNKLIHELFTYDFYFFRYKFLKYIDVVLYDGYISDYFVKKIIKLIISKSIFGRTKIRFKIKDNGIYKYILLHFNLNISVHDELLLTLRKINEIKNIEFIYSF